MANTGIWFVARVCAVSSHTLRSGTRTYRYSTYTAMKRKPSQSSPQPTTLGKRAARSPWQVVGVVVAREEADVGSRVEAKVARGPVPEYDWRDAGMRPVKRRRQRHEQPGGGANSGDEGEDAPGAAERRE